MSTLTNRERAGNIAQICFGLLYLIIGVVCIGVWYSNPIECAISGNLPLGLWVNITGVSYTILSGCYLISIIVIAISRGNDEISKLTMGLFAQLLITVFGLMYILIWSIVGSVSICRDSGACMELNYILWNTALVVIVVSYIPIIFSLVIIVMIHMKVTSEHV